MKITLKALRTNRFLSQEEAAKKIGVSCETWSHYETGRSKPSFENGIKIEKEFNVMLKDIVFSPEDLDF